MDAEEKKSSPNVESGSSLTRQAGFKLHCFPDIEINDSPEGRHCAPPEKTFERIRFQNLDSNCPDDVCGSADHQNPQADDALSLAEIEEKAYRQGFADGKQKGMIDGENAGFELGVKKLEPVLAGLQQALLQVNRIREDAYHNIEKEVVELAMAIARKVICHEVETDREAVMCIAREALSKVENPGKITIKMNPSDLQFINETKYQLSNLVENLENVKLQPEQRIQSGGCIIETDLGQIDARIEKQLQAVEASFRAAMKESNTDGCGS